MVAQGCSLQMRVPLGLTRTSHLPGPFQGYPKHTHVIPKDNFLPLFINETQAAPLQEDVTSAVRFLALVIIVDRTGCLVHISWTRLGSSDVKSVQAASHPRHSCVHMHGVNVKLSSSAT